MRFVRDERGQMVIMTALSLTALLGFAGLAADVGVLFHAQRELQIAADSAATTAAMDINYGESAGSAATDAQDTAIKNGWSGATLVQDSNPPTNTTSLSGTQVTVNNPPLSGYHQTASYVEVYVTEPNPTFFMKLFGISSQNVTARAVAGSPGAGSACVWLGATTGIGLELHGSGSMTATGCGVYINSSSSDALYYHDASSSLSAAWINVNGGIDGTPSPTKATANAPPESDPLGNISGPNPSSVCSSTNTSTATSFTATSFNKGVLDASLYGGFYCFTGSMADISYLTLENGTFIFENGVTAADHANTTIQNGTLDLYQGQFNQSTNSNLNVTAPTVEDTGAGLYNGIGILVPASTNTYYTPTDGNEMQLQFGSNNQTIDGYFYGPNVVLSLHDQGGGVTYSGIIAWSIPYDNSSIDITSYNKEHPTTTPIRTFALVE